MAKKAKDLATSQLISYQQIIGMSNEHMDQFATNMEEFHKQKKIGKPFLDEILRELQPKVEKNNKVLTDIENELYSRIKRDFPDATTPNALGKYFKKYREELVSQAKINEDVKKSSENHKKDAPVKKPNFKVEE